MSILKVFWVHESILRIKSSFDFDKRANEQLPTPWFGNSTLMEKYIFRLVFRAIAHSLDYKIVWFRTKLMHDFSVARSRILIAKYVN